ncbi:7932_t:CDS:2, partial [Entrophospora sp. SA101]
KSLVEIGHLEISGGYNIVDKPRSTWDHLKGAIGNVYMLGELAHCYKKASFQSFDVLIISHTVEKQIELWGMSNPTNGVLLMERISKSFVPIDWTKARRAGIKSFYAQSEAGTPNKLAPVRHVLLDSVHPEKQQQQASTTQNVTGSSTLSSLNQSTSMTSTTSITSSTSTATLSPPMFSQPTATHLQHKKRGRTRGDSPARVDGNTQSLRYCDGDGGDGGRGEQRRYRSDFAPRKTKYRKAHKGRVPVRVGGSTKGNTIAFGEYGLRVTYGVRLTSAQLTAARNALKRKLKPIKEAKLWMRVFPDIPVTAKGNEVRMGKGKGSFEYWACRVPMNKIVFEIGGGNMRREVAKDILKMASDRLPVVTEFVEIDRKVA